MENLSTKTPKAIKLIRGLFILLTTVLFLVVVLLFVLNINYTVDIQRGEIISKNIPIEYQAPFEVRIQTIRVGEGDRVSSGDTLMILDNQQMLTAVLKSENELRLIEKNITVFQNLLNNLDSQIQHRSQQRNQINTAYEFEQKEIQLGLDELEKQINIQTRSMEISKQKLQRDLSLLRDGIISKLEYNTDHKTYLKEKEKHSELQRRFRQQRNQFAALPNQQSRQVNNQDLSMLSGQYDRSQIEKQLIEENIRKVQVIDQLNLHRSNLEKCVLIATQDGFISKIYNVKIDANFVVKGTPLMVLSPKEETQFYAEMSLSQQAIRSVKSGQTAHLKLDAYNYYQYGILKGEVSFIKKDTSNNFFVLAALDQPAKHFNLQSGYQVKGEIVIEQVKLYQFILRKLFRNIEV